MLCKLALLGSVILLIGAICVNERDVFNTVNRFAWLAGRVFSTDVVIGRVVRDWLAPSCAGS